MYLHEERLLCGDYPLNSQPRNYGNCPPDWKDAVLRGQSWNSGVKVGCEPELSALQVRVSLQGRELWEQFGDIGTEMLITKTGRRMFPSCRVTVTGLNPQAKYVLMMDMVSFDDDKYKWSRDRWEVSGMTEPHLPNRFFIHPDSPSLGERWMQYPVSFHKLKLTNNTLNSNGLVVLHSMHKYQPRLHIVQSPDPYNPLSGGYLRFTFPEAAFIAVTAYQNSEITKLKIDNNPFAKGFRDNGLNRKRFREKEGQSSKKLNERQLQMELKSSNGIVTYRVGSRPVESDDEADVIVSSCSSGNSYGAAGSRTDDITSLPAAPNPLISAFMNWGAAAAALPCGQEGWGVLDPMTHNTHTYNTLTTRDYGSPGQHNEARHTGLSNVASPLFLPYPPLGQTHHLGSVGFRRPQAQSRKPVGPHPPHHQRGPSGPAPELSHSHTSDHQPQQQQPEPHQAEFDYPLPLPPKVSRMHLPESALRSLEMSSSPSVSGSPWSLTDMLNRIHSSEGSGINSVSPQGKLLQAQAQYERPGLELGVNRELWPPQPNPPLPDHEPEYLPLHNMMRYHQNSLIGSAGLLRDSHVDPRVPSCKAPMLDL
ncbi:T-box transcription factor TBX6L isoform X1 [Salmo trutta]|uniref:T-box transcription factor TBX6L isoform X1 n=1 Tax=Salmo trutta TaxID=8032 RepID=UPI001130B829|nr:T-box transcription factor TBX6L-like isoform X1 [Salmo trutta]